MFLANIIIVFSSMAELSVTSSKTPHCGKHLGQESQALVINAIKPPVL